MDNIDAFGAFIMVIAIAYFVIAIIVF